MLAFRWILGSVIGLLAGGFVLLCVVASGFRRSFGASEISPILLALPVVAMAILFLGVLFPHCKALLHTGAVTAVGLIAFCIWQVVADVSIVLLLGVTYLVTWLAFYWIAVFKNGGV